VAKSIQSIEGIGPKLGEAFRGAGIKTVDDLLDAATSKPARGALAEKTGISEVRVLKYVNMADLFRINGVASQYAELLECAGVDTIKELQHRNAENLAAKMTEVNDSKNLVRRTPSVKVVQDWISQASKLPPKVTY
jgi:predicted flap endonuclease-1-like 5' DNA nuclease